MILHHPCLTDSTLNHNKIGKHLQLTNSRTTSSEATLPIFPKIALMARKNPRLASSNEHSSNLDLTKCTPRYRTSSTYGELYGKRN